MNTNCPRCNKEVIQKWSEKKQKNFNVNPDGSFHQVPVTQQDGTTKWYCCTSKEHAEWCKSHNGPSGFVEPTSKPYTKDQVMYGKEQPKELEAVIETRQHSPQMNLARETVLDAFFEADSIVTKIYPNLSKTSGTYGQIRSKFTDQILQAYKTITIEESIRNSKI